jgi:hypothetical protein
MLSKASLAGKTLGDSELVAGGVDMDEFLSAPLALSAPFELTEPRGVFVTSL